MYPIDDLVDGYLAALSVAGVEPPSSFRTEILRVPHVPPSLPSGFGAVYVFSLADVGKFGNAGPGRVLKVGKVGAASNNRFQYQHYSTTAAGSTLARSIVDTRILWPFLGIDAVTSDDVKSWIVEHTDRHHVYLSAVDYQIHGTLLEKFIRGVTGPVFEG